ncbi:hypothetical protein IWW50_001761 [Coemansia erecta]|nr:hypothetical protein IWW50_001761 [Coemansia erecta]
MYRSVGGANHQGVIMKVSEYSAPRISELSPFVDGSYNITEKVLTTREPRRRFPFWVYCHDLQDSSNFGSIIRSAMFFGADAVLTPAQNVVKPTPLVSKASSGAMECMDIYRVSRHENFFAKVQKNGWLVVCATISSAGDTRMETIDSMPPLSAPTILVIGNERSGIPDSILEQSDLNVYISPRAELPNYIDSLNAGVAAGIILSSLKFKGE